MYINVRVSRVVAGAVCHCYYCTGPGKYVCCLSILAALILVSCNRDWYSSAVVGPDEQGVKCTRTMFGWRAINLFGDWIYLLFHLAYTEASSPYLLLVQICSAMHVYMYTFVKLLELLLPVTLHC